MKSRNYISNIFLDSAGLPVPTPEIEHERNIAIYDILQENSFSFIDEKKTKKFPRGPYHLHLSIKNSLLVFTISDEKLKDGHQFYLSLTPLKPIIKDYFDICKSYFDAVKRLPPSQIETIDMGRRGIHLEGARVLMERLSGKVVTDTATAKRLFTLICALRFN